MRTLFDRMKRRVTRANARTIATGTVWIGMLLVVTLVLYSVRDTIQDPSEVVLVYLLIVLAVSSSGGRVLGFAVAVAGFLLIDYYFQVPYDTLSIGKPVDGAILAAFFAIAFTTTHLLARARAEAEQARSQLAEIERLSHEARHVEALREAAHLKDVLLASVSHDLRTPLTAIKALAQDSAESGDENARIIVTQAERLSRMVGDLLDLSQLNAGGFPLVTELNTAEDLVGTAVQQLVGSPGRSRVRTQIDYSRPALVGTFDFVHSLRILTNLLDNAMRYAPGDTPIVLSANREGDWLAFRVEDAGPGIPENEWERVFEPFYRRTATATVPGTGLGLAIAARLAEAQRGRLEYAPGEKGGSVFTLYLVAFDSVPAS